MTLAFVALIAGLALLVWSADKFVDGAAATARYAGMPPLLIGMVIIGFGTSAPEMVVSALASMQGNPGLALGNAYGSNITNIALILGLTALISPIAVSSQVVRKEIPILLGITLLTGALLIDGHLGRSDALILGGVFIGLLGWSIWTGIKGKGGALDEDVNVGRRDHSPGIWHQRSGHRPDHSGGGYLAAGAGLLPDGHQEEGT